VHEFEPIFREDAIFRYPDIVEMVTQMNQLVKSLAPVLNTPSLSGKARVNSQVPIATMVKVYDNETYLFAVAMQNSPSTAHITIDDIGDANARVIGENRIVAIKQGTLEDRFKGYGVHLYRIS